MEILPGLFQPVDREHAEALSPGFTAFIGFAAQAKLAKFESTRAPALHKPSFLGSIIVTRRGHKAYELDRQSCADYIAILATL